MKCLCITGIRQADLESLATFLGHAGMRQAAGTRKGEAIDIATWHTEVVAQAAQDAEESVTNEPITQPGRLWEKLAADIFLANLDAPLWGWADTRSTRLLEFWAQFEPRMYFILVCTSPQRLLAAAMAADEAPSNIEALMDEWIEQHELLLRFHHRFPQRSLLVDVDECNANTSALLAVLRQQWRLPLAETTAEIPNTSPDALALHLSHAFTSRYPNALSLQQEIDATRTPLRDESQAAAYEAPEPDEVIKSYRALRDRSAERTQLERTLARHALLDEEHQSLLARQNSYEHATGARLRELTTENDFLLQQSYLAQEELKALRTNLEAALTANQQLRGLEDKLVKVELDNLQLIEQVLLHQEDSSAAHASLQRAQADHAQGLQSLQAGHQHLEDKLKETQAENELLLLQLHQTQKELEGVFRKHEEVRKQNDHLTQGRTILENEKAALAQAKAILEKDRNALTQARDEQQKLANERQAQIAQLTKARDEQTKLANERQALVTQLTKAGDEQAKLANERKAQIAQLTQIRSSLEQAKSALEREKAALLANPPASSAQAEAMATTQRQLKEQQEENELLLLQLHQVQEELEHYFLQHQDMQRKLKESEERWQRMLQQNPAYTDFSGIEIIDCDAPTRSCAWRFTNIDIAGRNLTSLQFRTILIDDRAGFIFERPTSPALHYWQMSPKSDVLGVHPADSNDLRLAYMATLMLLPTSDWSLVKALLDAVRNALADPSNLRLSLDFPSAALGAGLHKLQLFLEQLPQTFRFDAVRLHREQVNPDYEHLWFELDRPSFGATQWPTFEFRLSCAHVTPNRFGYFPKLEFPKGNGQTPFENWFIESEDDFGQKFELRFSVEHGLDLAVWKHMAARDQQLVQALTAQLPSMLNLLQAQGQQLQRDWSDWISMAQTMQAILQSENVPSVPVRKPPEPERRATERIRVNKTKPKAR